MSLSLIKDIRAAYSNLNPQGVRADAEREVNVALMADSQEGYPVMERFLAPLSLSPEKRSRSMQALHRISDTALAGNFDFVICDEGVVCPGNGYTFYRSDPGRTVCDVLNSHQDIELSLARNFFPFREEVVDRIIHRISRENAMFSLVTALPDVIPSFIEFPWAVGEFATDTAFLTINQVRMAFLIAGASDNEIGYAGQKGEIATIIASAFGWRALARELIGKIPFGGGLLPKGAIAYAGTYVAGKSLDAYHRTGYGLSRVEQREAYSAALARGRGVVDNLLATLKGGLKKPSAA